ncbi:hypothetical protein [Deinococcus fonticola]|uniref:hypothetical protein n=1 Tax=Deinococcus fonticola TaxID=2528713 RepID=UPI001075045B|nr:hypothetical protein [Deinococcus fonticola]
MLSFAAWIFLIVEFGTNISAPRLANEGSLNNISALVFSVKFLTSIIVMIFGLVFALFSSFPADTIFYGIILGIAQGFIPTWFYIYKDRLHIIIMADFVVQISILLISFFISIEVIDIKFLIPLYVVLFSLYSLIANYTVFLENGFKRSDFIMSEVFRFSYDSRGLILNRIVISLYTALNSFIVYVLLGASAAAVFSNSEKLCKAINVVNDTGVKSYYGKLIKISEWEKKKYLVTRLGFILLFLNLLYVIILRVFGSPIVDLLFGQQYDEVKRVITVYSLVMIPISIMYALGSFWLNSIGREDVITVSILVSVAIGIPFILFFGMRFGVIGYALGVVMLESLNLLIMSIQTVRSGLWPFKFSIR